MRTMNGLNSVLLVILVTLMVACNSTAVRTTVDAKSASLSPTEVDQLLVVDCLLPGQVRKLGGKMTYLTPRRAVKTDAKDCEIRGGEYVSYDRANYATALKIWLPQAQEGDAAAQTYVGEIYEKGLGVTPDYAVAAMWYEKAALQGYAAAQINLGYLYEKGLGVEKDTVVALNWYRKASGMGDDDIEYASTITTQVDAQTQVLRQEVRSLKVQLDQTQGKLDSRKQELDGLRRQLEQERTKLQQLKSQAGSGSSAAIVALERRVQQQESQLRQANDVVSRLEQDASYYQEKWVELKQSADDQDRNVGPSIEILEPPLAVVNGRPGVKVRSISKQRQIVGKALSPAGVKELLVNNKLEPIEKDGTFRVSVAVEDEDTPVNLVVYDEQERRAEFDFMLVRTQGSVPKTRSIVSEEYFTAQEALGIEFGTYYALIIGNNDYVNFPRLETAVNDARKVEKVLRTKYRFNTTLLLNANRYAILSSLNELRKKLTGKDNLLIYYAGHGELDRINLRGHWLPVDAKPDDPTNWISNVAVTDMLNAMDAKHILVVADSCYSGALSQSAVARLGGGVAQGTREKWLSIMAKTRARLVLTSGGLQPVLDAGGRDHSVFARAFIGTLEGNQGILEGHGIFEKVNDRVQQVAASFDLAQIPQYAPVKHAGHESGEFFFVPAN